MASEIHKAPYSRLEPVLTALRAIRTKGVPDQITSATLTKWGVTESIAYQVIQTLRFLHLIDDQGKPTEDLENLRRANPEEYPAVLSDIVQRAYYFIFDYFNPAQEDLTAIDHAFFKVEPRGQKERMEWLFIGLCREAGILPKDDKPPRMPQTKSRMSISKSKPRNITHEMSTQRLEPAMIQGAHNTFQPATLYEAVSGSQNSALRNPRVDPRYDLLVNLIEKLPPSGAWTEAEHKLWTLVWDGALKMCVQVVPDGQSTP